MINERISKAKSRMYTVLSSSVAVVLLVGMIVFHFVEGWTWIDSLYFSAITLTTVGYGDLAPTTPLTKIFTMIYIFLGISIIFAFINQIAKREEELDIRRKKYSVKNKRKFVKKSKETA